MKLYPPQLDKAIKEIEELRLFKTKAVTIFAVVQFLHGSGSGSIKDFLMSVGDLVQDTKESLTSKTRIGIITAENNHYYSVTWLYVPKGFYSYELHRLTDYR